jgi:adenosylcobyric acid synthase
MKGSVLVAGTGSDAGKSVIVAGLCRLYARRGIRVAPFKAQNMSLNSAVTPDGAEIGRAQAAQAFAAGLAPEAAMNPILLKPTDDRRAQVIVLGHPVDETDAQEYVKLKPKLMDVVVDAYESLRSRFDVVLCEGAGSPAEINLRENDVVNMGFARRARLPVVIVGDIDRGGVFASLYGSVALLDAEDQALVCGYIINKFRGDLAILEPGLRMIEALTGRTVLGVVPWLRDVWIDAEDALSIEVLRRLAEPPIGTDSLRVAVVALPHMSNFTDFDPLVCEPGVTVTFTRSHSELMNADLLVLPGTKATVADLECIRSEGLDAVILQRATQGKPVLGVCGGYQMLGSAIVDHVEAGIGEVAGLDLLPVTTTFGRDKILRTPHGTSSRYGGAEVHGYEIRHGRVDPSGGHSLFESQDGPEGCVRGSVFGTSWHGIFECDGFRRAFLSEVARTRGLQWTPGTVAFATFRAQQTDCLADILEGTLDVEGLAALIEGPLPRFPTLVSGLSDAMRPQRRR